MPTFRYKAYRADGREATGTIEAETLRDATLRLKRDGLLASELVPADLQPAGMVGRRGRKAVGLPELTL
ncbi:MAG TPA: type II secretion system protein GspF, partial [Geobacteraceae bacterium]